MNKFYKDYEKAVLNEIELDEKAYSLLGMKPSEYAFIPRPLKFVRYLKNKFYFSRVFSFVLPLGWLLVTPFFFLYQLFFTFKGKLMNKKVGFPINSEQTLYLVYSTRALEVFKKHDAGFQSKYYVSMPWLQTDFFEDNSLSLLGFLSYRKLFKAYLVAIQSVLIFYLLSGKKVWTLQTYSAFRWFVVYFAIRDLNNVEFVCAEHYDRWAVLTDLTVTNNRLFGDSSCSLTIMQHGFLGSLTHEQEPLKLPYKLLSVSHIYVYNDAEYQFFNRYVLGKNSISLIPECHSFTPKIELTTIGSVKHVPYVLFVGNPVCEDFHMLLFDSLQKKLKNDVVFYYKPHPLTPGTERVNNVNWSVIKDKKQFPFVDLVISYPSTLEYEYALHGIKTISHAIDAPSAEVQFYAGQVFSILNKFYLGDTIE
ncbi:MAG: hypothetical protein IE909_09930 [Campylobacterales bacterium]|nr:hypothetical protein [Campylobacterales bacterium]